jgi:hypothetical protein
MHTTSVRLSRENADRVQQVRVEIGRRLRESYDAAEWPMSDRLEDLVRKIQDPNGRFEEGWPMSKPDEYRANAQECERMAAISRNPNEKASLLEMAQQWLGMIPKVGSTKPDQFDAARVVPGGPTKSEE